jgi:mono/diheme cytochrome c family protein
MRQTCKLASAVLVTMILALPTSQAEEESTIAFGGQLYDNWIELTEGATPDGTHPAYPASGSKKGRSTWRCKECHGWDYLGKDGAYGPGSRAYTGIKGIRGMDGAEPAAVLAVLEDATHALPPALLSERERMAIALFVSRGQFDVTRAYDLESGKALGDVGRGAGYFNTVCAKCHGLDGDGPENMEETLGSLANRVPAEVVHKIRNGDLAPEMPALRAFPEQIMIDILAYTQTLPTAKGR